MVQKNRSPNARNFRMYAENTGDRRVTISSRKGAGRHLDPLSETISVSDQDTTNSTDALLGIDTNWKAMPFTPTTTGPLTMVDLRMKKNGATGPVRVEIWTNNSGAPGELLAESGILGSDIGDAVAYVTCRFYEAPSVTNGTQYWIVVYQQDDSTGNYVWRTNSASTLALTSANSGLSWTAAGYSLSYKAYVSDLNLIKGMTRYTPSNSTNKTLVAINQNVYRGDDGTHGLTSIVGSMNAAATEYYFTFMDDKAFWVNGYDSLKSWDGTTVDTITHANLPILRYVIAYKERLWGLEAGDPNRMVYSELPGNDDGAGNEWYDAWLSTSYRYVPRPKANDPITGIVPFQDTLVIFTRSSKYILYGSDPGDFTMRESTGKKGATHQRAIWADENYIYFASNDGLYRFDGTNDLLISELVQTEVDAIADMDQVRVAKWNRQIRFYYPSAGSSVQNRCLIWHTVFEEWLLDTDTYVSMATPWTDGDDEYELAEVSSLAPAVHLAEQDDHAIGRAIDFEYDCKYDSLGNPAQRKRIVKLMPLLDAAGNHPVEVGVDRDLKDDPRFTTLDLTVGGTTLGTFDLNDGVTLGMSEQFKPMRVRVSGAAYYWQLRFKRKGINNSTRVIGYVLSYRTKKL